MQENTQLVLLVFAALGLALAMIPCDRGSDRGGHREFLYVPGNRKAPGKGPRKGPGKAPHKGPRKGPHKAPVKCPVCPVCAAPTPAPTPKPTPTPASRGGSSALLIFFGIAALATAGGAVWLMSKRKPLDALNNAATTIANNANAMLNAVANNTNAAVNAAVNATNTYR